MRKSTKRSFINAGMLALVMSSAPALAGDGMSGGSYDWSGFYAGGLLGYGTGDDVANAPYNGFSSGFDGSAPNDRSDLTPDGVVGGLVAGRNWQRGRIVFGGEAELGYLGAKDSVWFPNGQDYFAKADYGLYGSLSARFGFAMDRTLFSARAGAIVARINSGYGDIDGGIGGSFDPNGSVFSDFSQVGLLVGASVEHAFMGTNWIGRADYSYMDFGAQTLTDGYGATYHITHDLHQFRLGVIRKF
jgi:outer membrane immunogenic protein